MAEKEDFDPDSFDLHDAEIDEKIPWSFSYFLICILLPMMAGGINGFAWSGYALYVRSMGWSLPMAGLGVSLGSLTRLPVQQVIFRAGIWTCAVFATLQTVIASLAVAFPQEAWIVFTQAGAIAGLDVTVAIEGITFAKWSDSEVMVGQATSTILSVFTISYATAATLGGVLYDVAGWTGMSVFHTACAAGQLLVIVMQPIIRQSFRDFIYGPQQEEDEEVEVTEIKTVEPELALVAIVPAAPEGDASARASSPPSPEASAQASPSSPSRPFPALPGGVEEDGSPGRASVSSQASPAATPIRGHPPESSRQRRSTVRSKASKASKATQRANSRESSGLIMRGFLGRESYVSYESGNSGQTRKSQQTRLTGRTVKSSQTGKSGKSFLSSLSRFTSLSQAGENFQYNYGVTNGLRPHIPGVNFEEGNLGEDEEDEETSGRKTEVTSGEGATPQTERKSRKSAVEKKRLPRDMYIVAFLVAMCSFNTNTSYAIEWATYAIFFQEQHGWTSATWAGVCQTSGDLLAALIMGLLKGGDRPVLDELSGPKWLWHAVTGQPYNLVILCFLWVVLNAGLCVPVLPVAIASQVIMGTVYVFSVKAVTDLNLFYSLGESQIFMQLQVQCRNADAIGATLSGYVAMVLYDMFPLAPFLLSTCISVVASIFLTAGFCWRVGFGKDIETAEAQRSRRLGLRRVSTWKSQRKSVAGGD